tara:strand:+ start:350 stop:529 length:180 start_codon:yes stop_codon:yes gene_type:complete
LNFIEKLFGKFGQILIHIQAEMEDKLNSLSNLIASDKIICIFILTLLPVHSISWKMYFI